MHHILPAVEFALILAFVSGLRGIATVLTGALSLLAGIGILNMNLRGPGFTESVKTLWRKKSFVEEE